MSEKAKKYDKSVIPESADKTPRAYHSPFMPASQQGPQGRLVRVVIYCNGKEPQPGTCATNQLHQGEKRIGLDAVINARNDLIAMNCADTSAVRDQVVFVIDLLVQVLTEHFPLISETRPPILPAEPEPASGGEGADEYSCSFTASGEHASSPQGDCIYCGSKGRAHKMRQVAPSPAPEIANLPPCTPNAQDKEQAAKNFFELYDGSIPYEVEAARLWYIRELRSTISERDTLRAKLDYKVAEVGRLEQFIAKQQASSSLATDRIVSAEAQLADLQEAVDKAIAWLQTVKAADWPTREAISILSAARGAACEHREMVVGDNVVCAKCGVTLRKVTDAPAVG